MIAVTVIIISICHSVFVSCPHGDDDEWAITWPNTPGGSISTQPCPGGVDTNGELCLV